MSMGRVLSLAASNLKRSYREPAFLFLVLLFPVALTVLFGTAFGAMGSAPPYQVGMVDMDGSEWSKDLTSSLEATGAVSLQRFDELAAAQESLSQGGLSAVIVVPAGFGDSCSSYVENGDDSGDWTFSSIALYIDPASAVASSSVPLLVESVLLDVLEAAPSTLPVTVNADDVAPGQRLSVFETMAPGVITFSVIFFTMIVGQSFSEDRERGLLRRIRATPTSSLEFMASNLLSNMVLASLQVALIFIIMAVLGFRFAASPEGMVSAIALVLLFSVCAVGLGLITAAVARSSGQATGIAFLFIMPQMFLGTFMGATLSPEAHAAGMATPAYYVTEGLTALLLEGASLSETVVLVDVIVVAAFGIAAMIIGAVLFERYGGKR